MQEMSLRTIALMLNYRRSECRRCLLIIATDSSISICQWKHSTAANTEIDYWWHYRVEARHRFVQ